MPGPLRAPDAPCRGCTACKAFEVLRKGLRSAAGFLLPLTLSDEVGPRRGSGHSRQSLRSSTYPRRRGMGSTRPVKSSGFIYGSFKGPAVIPSSGSAALHRPPAFYRSHTTVEGGGHCLAHSSSSSAVPGGSCGSSSSNYALAQSSSAHALLSRRRLSSASSARESGVKLFSASSQGSLGTIGHACSVQSLSSSSHSLASTVATLTPHASVGSLNALSAPLSKSPSVPASMSKKVVSHKKLRSPEVPGNSGQGLSRSSSAINWKEALRPKKSVVLYDSQRSKSSDREGILPMIRNHVFGDKRSHAGCGKSLEKNGHLDAKDSKIVKYKCSTKEIDKRISEKSTKESIGTKSTIKTGEVNSKPRNRRNGFRRFTTSVLPSQIFGFAKNSGRNVRKHEANSPVEKEAPMNPAKIQRLSSVTEQCETEVSGSIDPPLRAREVNGSIDPPLRARGIVHARNDGNGCNDGSGFASRNGRPSRLADGVKCTGNKDLGHKDVPKLHCYGGRQRENCPKVFTRSSNISRPRQPDASSSCVLSRAADLQSSKSGIVGNRSSIRSRSPPSSKSSFVPLGTSASCSAIAKPTPAPRTVFPTFTTPILGFRTIGRKSGQPKGTSSAGEQCRTVECVGHQPGKHLTSTPIRSARKPTHAARDNPIYYEKSSLDDSYTSHKGYLMNLKNSPSATYNGPRTYREEYNGPLTYREDIPWITTPPGNRLKTSRSLFNISSEEKRNRKGVVAGLHEFRLLNHHLLAFGYKENEVEGSSEKKWARSNSLRRPFHRARENSNVHGHHHHHHHRHQDPAAHSDTEIGKISAPNSLLDGECGSRGGSVTSERAIDVGRVSAWAASFEKLLEDPAGLHTFAEFLKKEYSHENIYFWTACERYKRLSSPEELQAMAKVIFERHLCIGASEPVNVDSQARQDAQDSLHNPNEFLFSQAQKQIFNLMKFDSYSRFLKSNLYQDCLARDMRGQTLPYPGDETMDPDLKIIQDDSHVALKKSKSDADERRRKSLLPWHRKDRSKSKDRGEAEYRRQKKINHRNQSDSSSVRSDMSGSRTSLNSSSDLALGRRAVSKESLTSGELGSLSGSEGYHRCRVILPDLSNSVVAIRHGETVQELLTRLLERRGISYSTFEVYQNKTDKLIDKNDDSVVLGGMEVRIERRVLFRLDLPNRKTVCIKARSNKLTSDVLKPILHKYNYKLDLMSIHRAGEAKGIDLKGPITSIDGDRLVVQTKEEVKEWGVDLSRQKKKRGTNNTLDEITNRVFEDLLKGKSEQGFDELGILDFDARSSRTEHSSDQSSSGVTGGFGLRNSVPTEKEMIKSRKAPNRSSVHDGLGVRGMPPPDHALITKRRGMGSTTPNPNDELYEGLKRAQRSRLDDQRGTEINFELPDFLKCYDDQPEDKENQRAHLTDQLLAQLECSFSEGSVIPSHREAEDYFSMAHPEVWGGLPASPTGPHSANATLMAPPDLDLDDFDDTLVADDSPSKVPMPDATSTSLHMDPPDFSPPPPIPMENSSVPSVPRIISPALQLSPPPLPPKPKLGGTRGPPPRPPSRQLHPFNPPTTFSSTSDDDALQSALDAPIHMGRQSISFV